MGHLEGVQPGYGMQGEQAAAPSATSSLPKATLLPIQDLSPSSEDDDCVLISCKNKTPPRRRRAYSLVVSPPSSPCQTGTSTTTAMVPPKYFRRMHGRRPIRTPRKNVPTVPNDQHAGFHHTNEESVPDIRMADATTSPGLPSTVDLVDALETEPEVIEPERFPRTMAPKSCTYPQIVDRDNVQGTYQQLLHTPNTVSKAPTAPSDMPMKYKEGTSPVTFPDTHLRSILKVKKAQHGQPSRSPPQPHIRPKRVSWGHDQVRTLTPRLPSTPPPVMRIKRAKTTSQVNSEGEEEKGESSAGIRQ